MFAPLKTLEKRTPANSYEQPALNFSTEDGKASQPRVFLRAVQNAAERCNLNLEGETDRVGVHTLSHFVASKLLANGVEMMVVSRILGHESIKTTVDIYGHLQDNQRKQALSSLA